jgi:hypothetical protein
MYRSDIEYSRIYEEKMHLLESQREDDTYMSNVFEQLQSEYDQCLSSMRGLLAKTLNSLSHEHVKNIQLLRDKYTIDQQALIKSLQNNRVGVALSSSCDIQKLEYVGLDSIVDRCYQQIESSTTETSDHNVLSQTLTTLKDSERKSHDIYNDSLTLIRKYEQDIRYLKSEIDTCEGQKLEQHLRDDKSSLLDALKRVRDTVSKANIEHESLMRDLSQQSSSIRNEMLEILGSLENVTRYANLCSTSEKQLRRSPPFRTVCDIPNSTDLFAVIDKQFSELLITNSCLELECLNITRENRSLKAMRALESNINSKLLDT